MQTTRILAPDEPAPARVYREGGSSDFFLTCDHAGNLIPKKLGTLGLTPIDLARHIAWDVGAAGVARRLSARLDATLVTQTYSRLVIDCNRQPERPDAMPEVSEATTVPGNRGLLPEETAARVAEVHRPYHRTIESLLDQRAAAGRRSVLIALHSFTPIYHGVERPWHIGLLYNRDPALALCLKEVLVEGGRYCIGDNEPYRVGDETDYGIPVHGEKRGITSLEIEIRHDQIETLNDQESWSAQLADWLTEALGRLDSARAA